MPRMYNWDDDDSVDFFPEEEDDFDDFDEDDYDWVPDDAPPRVPGVEHDDWGDSS